MMDLRTYIETGSANDPIIRWLTAKFPSGGSDDLIDAINKKLAALDGYVAESILPSLLGDEPVTPIGEDLLLEMRDIVRGLRAAVPHDETARVAREETIEYALLLQAAITEFRDRPRK